MQTPSRCGTCLILACALVTTVLGQSQSRRFTMNLWPAQPPGARSDPTYLETRLESDDGKHIPFLAKISAPTIEVFLPEPAKATGAAVVICPGGGYGFVADDHEGVKVAEWLNRHGVAGIVLRYRLPSDAIMEDKSIGPLQDAQEAIRAVRRRAGEWHLDPAKIGILGFSAGGHLAASASTRFAERVYEPTDAVSARPDFSILIYPVISLELGVTHMGTRENLLGPAPSAETVERFSNEQRVGDDTPPTFLVHSADDIVVPLENSLRYAAALHAHRVPAELHVYPHGGHGYGLGINDDSPKNWPDVLAMWLRANGW